MTVTAGSAGKLNTIKGIAKIIETTSGEETTLGSKVFPAGLLIKKTDGKIYVTDGAATLDALTPRVDAVVTAAEKAALSAAFSTGSYKKAVNGVVVHGADGKIDDASLKVVSNGKIVESYLTNYIDTDTHKVKLEVLPDIVRAKITYADHYSALASLSDEQKKGIVYVIDATDDPSGKVKSGAAMYVWEAGSGKTAGAWRKIAEVESLDIDVDAIKCDYANVQAAGGVMYDHPLDISMTATDLAALV